MLSNIKTNTLSTMYCRCKNNEHVDKAFMVGNLYQFTVNDKNWVTVYEPYLNMITGFIQPYTIHIDDFVLSFELVN